MTTCKIHDEATKRSKEDKKEIRDLLQCQEDYEIFNILKLFMGWYT